MFGRGMDINNYYCWWKNYLYWLVIINYDAREELLLLVGSCLLFDENGARQHVIETVLQDKLPVYYLLCLNDKWEHTKSRV